MRAKTPPVLQYVCLALLFVVAAGYQVYSTLYTFPDSFHRHVVYSPFSFDFLNGKLLILAVDGSSAAYRAGMRANDVFVSINGQPVTGIAIYGEVLRHARAGDTITLEILTPGQSAPHNISFPLEEIASPKISWGTLTILSFSLVMPVFCILLGFWVVAVRPRDPSAWFLCFIMLFFSTFYSQSVETWGPVVRDVARGYRVAIGNFWPIFMLLFGVYFPEPFPGKESFWWKWSKNLVISALCFFAVWNVIVQLGKLENFAAVSTLSSGLDHLARFQFLLSFAATGAFFACISAKMGKAVTPDAKRRLRLLYLGSSISMGPACILFVTEVIKGGTVEHIFPKWFVLTALLLMLLFPITLAYVIVVNRAMDVRVVVRQGLQYALATNGVRILQAILIFITVLAAVGLASDPNRSRPQKIAAMGWGVAIAIWLSRGAIRVRQWIDKRFFREAHDAEQILSSLSEEVRTIVEKRPLLERVATQIAESLHIPRVAVLLEENGIYSPAFVLGYSSALDADLAESGAIVSHLKREANPERIYFDDDKSWVNSSNIPEDELRKLNSLQPQVLLPLKIKEKLLGIISLGERRAEAPYSSADLRILKTVASQTALALSNAELTSAIAVEVSRREKLNREIEIAREVQERLFPQRLPEISGLDYFGFCRTALGVGGDYYDFLALPNGKLGVALGDVSGKGIAAALTMASLQASLRADAMRAGDNIAGLITRVNAMLYDASTEDRYATLFYAQYDPATRRLSYVNAGHCPPILLRCKKSSSSAERLDQAGGTVVGLLPECDYAQAEVTLSPGDLLVIYTDGFSEAMNLHLEEWGEERLIASVADCDGLPAKDVITRIMQAADAFASGAPQSDDMTLVILRAK